MVLDDARYRAVVRLRARARSHERSARTRVRARALVPARERVRAPSFHCRTFAPTERDCGAPPSRSLSRFSH